MTNRRSMIPGAARTALRGANSVSMGILTACVLAAAFGASFGRSGWHAGLGRDARGDRCMAAALGNRLPQPDRTGWPASRPASGFAFAQDVQAPRQQAPPAERADGKGKRHRKHRPRPSYVTLEVAPLPGWPKWLGEMNYQISGLAFRDQRLYAAPDQSSAETHALLEIGLGSPGSSSRKVSVRVLCRWQGGPHPDAEGLALEPSDGPPSAALMPLESEADALIEVGLPDCELRGVYGPLTGKDSNKGIEGIALSPDGQFVYLTHENKCTLLGLARGTPPPPGGPDARPPDPGRVPTLPMNGPPRLIAKIRQAASLCDAAYDDRGTTGTDDDRLLLLDRNALQILDVTLSGEVVGRWALRKRSFRKDPDGFSYKLVSLEGLAIESRDADGSLVVYAATDSPPPPFPYHRRWRRDPEGLYQRRVGMLYRFRLPPVEP